MGVLGPVIGCALDGGACLAPEAYRNRLGGGRGLAAMRD